MPQFKHVGASVVVDGEELTEIVDESNLDNHDQDDIVTRYVQVSEGSHFGVKISIDNDYWREDPNTVLLEILLDGHEALDLVLHKDKDLNTDGLEQVMYGERVDVNGHSQFHKFQFSALKIGKIPFCFSNSLSSHLN